MITEKEKEIVKNSFTILKDNLPKIKKKAEKKELNEIVEYSNNLLKILDKIDDKYETIENYIDDINAECNNMFFFITKKKLTKNLKAMILEILLATLHINEILGIEVTYVEDHDNGRYEGEIKDGKREGFGKYYYSTGDYYEGEFKNNHKDGKGKYVYFNKDVYIGEYKDGKIHGKGKYIYKEDTWKRKVYIQRR